MAKFRKASADEVQAKRAEHTKSVGGGGLVMLKGFRAPPSWNKDERSARFVMSSESVDRYRDIVVQAGLEVERFNENPQGLLFHNSRCWPCGLWSDVTKVLNGRPKRTEGKLTFLPEGTDEDADRAARHVAAGSLRTVSIGFQPDWDEVDFILDDDDDWTGGFRFNKSELYECSLVPIPAQPDALVKDAGGDMVLARSLIEEILDTYAKTPEGLLIPMDEYRAKHFDLSGSRSTFVIDKALAPKVKEVKVAAAGDMRMKASTDEEAQQFVGASVMLDPANVENKEWPFDILAKATGEVVASYIVHEGENKGVHGLWVEYLTDGYEGMFRGIKADRFLLAGAAEEKDDDEPDVDIPDEDDDKAAPLTDEVLNAFAALVKTDDVVVLRDADHLKLVIERSGEEVEYLLLPDDMTITQIREVQTSIAKRAAPQPVEEVDPLKSKISIELDVSDATEQLSGLERLVDAVAAKMAKLFGRSAEPTTDKSAPEVKAAPTQEEVDAMKARAASILADIASKELA